MVHTNDNPQPLPPGVPPQFQMREYIPPPPQPIPNMRSNHIAKAKEDGNNAFRAQKYPDAIRFYSISAALAASRPIFESAQYSRDELSIALCNRSAAYAADGQWVEALVDANATIGIKKQWTKGYFRKGKALEGLKQFEEAKEALLLGLEFEPGNEVGLPSVTMKPRFPAWSDLSPVFPLSGLEPGLGRSREGSQGSRQGVRGSPAA